MNRETLRKEFEEAEREHNALEAECEEMRARIERAQAKQRIRCAKLKAAETELEIRRNAYTKAIAGDGPVNVIFHVK
jgi:predicted  nucleic acid-binding Zn-ribbon protein